MSNLSLKMRELLKNNFLYHLPKVVEIQKSFDGTEKFVLQLDDGAQIEMVLIPEGKKNTLCISTQVGCSRGCVFCATGKYGLRRNLSQVEIISEIIVAQQALKKQNIETSLTNIVFMGMGEPLDNYDNVLKALKIIVSSDGFCFSSRRITISTSGVVPLIYRIAEAGINIKLAISLNAAIKEKRSKLMPINDIYSLEELKKSLIYFRRHTKFRITIEYIMLHNFNMFYEDVKAIIQYCGDLSCKLNLIKWNFVEGCNLESPTEEQIIEFFKALQVFPHAVILRKSRGTDIAGACGQLIVKNSEE